MKPSDGLEPSTPSLPFRETRAGVSTGTILGVWERRGNATVFVSVVRGMSCVDEAAVVPAVYQREDQAPGGKATNPTFLGEVPGIDPPIALPSRSSGRRASGSMPISE